MVVGGWVEWLFGFAAAGLSGFEVGCMVGWLLLRPSGRLEWLFVEVILEFVG